MRRAVPLLLLLLATGCPSLEGFTGAKKDAGGPDSGLPGPGFLNLPDAVRFCSNAFACPNLAASVFASLLIPIDGANYSRCVDEVGGPLPPNHEGAQKQSQVLLCASGTSDCISATSCLFVESVDPASDPRCAGATGGANGSCSPDSESVYYCDAGIIQHCDSPLYYPGAQCVQYSDGTHGCALPGCTLTQDGQCQDSNLAYCGQDSNTVGVDCALQGAACSKDVNSGWFDCLVNGQARYCSAKGVVCSADRIRACDGYEYSDFDCGALGGTCDPSQVPTCVRSSDKCKQTDPGVNVCNGDRIQLCVGGHPLGFDCTSVGMKCVPGSSPQSSHCG